jgi:hypothetical protein
MKWRKNSLYFALLLMLWACQPSQADHADDAADLQRTETKLENAAIVEAFHHKKSNLQVSGSGVVSKLLRDDNKGSRHQRFLVKLTRHQTLLFAHNIDLAHRVPLQTGDVISFYGEYVYNPKGGIIHWTHHAPRNDHDAGWIMHQGIQYQ